MNRRLFSFFTSFLTFICVACFGQDNSVVSAIKNKMEGYASGKSSLLFVHFDKTVYTNNESIWFTAYIINADSTELGLHHTISVTLVKDDTGQTGPAERFVIQNGMGSGNMILPDTISPGNYHLLTCTNLLDKSGKPLLVFSQPITIKSTAVAGFNAAVKLLDSAKNYTGPFRIQFKANIDVDEYKKPPVFKLRYNIGRGVSKNATADIDGGYLLSIPRDEVNIKNNVLLVDAIYNKNIKHLSIKLPYHQPAINIKFYPEGGHLAADVLNTVGWEAKTADNRSVTIKGVLYKDEKAIDTLSTNGYGVGKFRLLPGMGNRYYLKIRKGDLVYNDTTYALPLAVNQLPSLNVPNAVANDTLKLMLRTTKATSVHLIIHNYRQVYSSLNFRTSNAGANLKIVLRHVPKGIATVTLLDSLYRPIAERLFFANYQLKDNLMISTNKEAYGKRENVEVNLKLNDNSSQTPLEGLVSVACIQGNRMEFAKEQDIESYTYLVNELGNLPPNTSGRGYDDKLYLENMLLIKGWRKFNWIDLNNAQRQDKAELLKSTEITGIVTRLDKALKKPVAVSVVADSVFSLINTDSLGRFTIPVENFVSYHDKKIMISVNRSDKTLFKIIVNDPYANISKAIAGDAEYFNNSGENVSSTANTKEMQLSGMDKINYLKEVKITAKKDDSIFGSNVLAGRNACGDYVCPYNILNCPNHPYGTLPIVGKRYINGQGTTVVYQGCYISPVNPSILAVKGIYTAKTFYPSDYSLGLSQPDYLSTIYWNNLVPIHNGEAKFKFPTSDVTGNYKIIVQGISENGVVYQTQSIEVKK